MSLHYIIDGYNVIKQNPSWIDLKLQDGRDSLIKFIQLNQISGSPHNKITIVFDAQANRAFCPFGNKSQTQEKKSGPGVVFAHEESADETIIEICRKVPNPKNIVLVSDDRQLQSIVRSQGAKSMSVKVFLNKADKFNKSNTKEDSCRKLSAAQERKINEELTNIWLGKK